MASFTVHPPAGRSLLIVVPAWRRVELAAICFRQMRHLCDRLHEQGLDARVVVIADDENLDTAAACGHITVEHENWLGAKLNVGYRYAHEHGFDYVVALGSDSWMHPERLSWLPDEHSILCTRNYVCVSPDGSRQGWFRMKVDGGVGTRVFPTALLASCNWEPLPPAQSSGCDTQTMLTIARGGRVPNLIYTDLCPPEVVGFQSKTQITRYDHLARHFLHRWQEPFEGLAEHFPAEFVDEIRALYERTLVHA